MDERETLFSCFSAELRTPLKTWFQKEEGMQEIRLRVNRPLSIRWNGEEFFIDGQGLRVKDIGFAMVVTEQQIEDTLSYMSDYSLYAYEEEIRQGYLTTKNGCRIGICGKVVLEGGRIKTIHHISSLNIRFPHEIKGCSEKLLPYIIEGDKVHNTLIISPPMCGKTTILRDLIRQISNGAYALGGKALGKTVGVVDERGEICACHLGVPQNDIGIKTDVLDGCPKVEGMMMLVRTMAPEVIAVDEIGSEEELQTMRYSMNCGCSILATAHGASIEELFKKKVFLMGREEGLFSRYIVLSRRQGAGTIEGVFDGKGNCIKILQNGGRT